MNFWHDSALEANLFVSIDKNVSYIFYTKDLKDLWPKVEKVDIVEVRFKNPFFIVSIDIFKAFVRRMKRDSFYIAIGVTFLNEIDKMIEYK